MRILKRLLRRRWQHMLNQPRLKEIASELKTHLNLPKHPSFVLRGARGYDSTYFVTVTASSNPIGVLRLVNSRAQRKKPDAGMPYTIGTPQERLDREWKAYHQASAGNAAPKLSPSPLWRSHDALLCEYLPYRALQDELMKHPEQAWTLLTRAAHAITKLHQIGLTHMDVSLANLLENKETGNIYFIDFEYSAAQNINTPTQRIYDHLRLVESAWKFIPEKDRLNSASWEKAFREYTEADLPSADLIRLKLALPRIWDIIVPKVLTPHHKQNQH